MCCVNTYNGIGECNGVYVGVRCAECDAVCIYLCMCIQRVRASQITSVQKKLSCHLCTHKWL